MAAVAQGSASGEQPARLSRYRSTRRPNAQAKASPAIPPMPDQTPVSDSNGFVNDALATAQESQAQSSENQQQNNPAIQRSMSRYRKAQRPANTDPAPAVPSLPSNTPDVNHNTEALNLPVRERTKHEGQSRTERMSTTNTHERTSANDSPIIPDETPVSMPSTLQHSRSRYRKAAPTKQESSAPQNKPPAARPAPAQDTLPPKTKQEHRDAIRRLKKQATFPSPTTTSYQPTAVQRSLTKDSLDQVPDANKEDDVNQFNQLKALRRRNTLGQQNEANMPRAAKAHASKAQEEVRKLLDAETERQRQMQEKIRVEKLKVKAAEEALEMAKQEEEEKQRQIVEEERQAKADAAAAIKEKKELEKAERRKKGGLNPEQLLPAYKRHRRQESQEERTARYRNMSLSKLEGGGPGPLVEASPATEQPSTSKDRLGLFKKTNDKTNIMQGGGGIVPGIDAPVSAVNAGDRRVLVECNRSSMFLPVTTSTTPQELIRSAATCLNEPINPRSSVLVEAFSKVGVQRPLRNYEHIRNVLNSWDDDKQNSLLLVPSPTGGEDVDLESYSVPLEQPDGMSCWLFYSQKPGKWDKKWVTLRADGQVAYSKSPDHKETKDMTNICHMSDFDIYSLEQRQSKRVKPPKKLCFAIKSQQKSNMFMSTENFVHFFATGEKQVAADWYKAVQGWRSWYLVNVMGEGEKPPHKQEDKTAAPMLPEIGGPQKPRPASMESHYQLGSFKPLLDFDSFGFGSDTFGDGYSSDRMNGGGHTRGKLSKTNAAPPSSFPRKLANDADGPHSRDASNGHSLRSAEDGTFAPSGLLGRSYSTRQKTAYQRDLAQNGPFTGGLLDAQFGLSTGTARPSLDQGRPDASELTRSTSRRKPQPLVDLTPGYQDPPQHLRKGRGYVPGQVGPGGLIDSATSPEHAIQVPAATDWRARAGHRSGGDPGSGSGSSGGIARNRSVRRPAEQDRDPDAGPFTGDGLLSSSRAGWGGGTTGRGVMDGSKVQLSAGMGPMLNVRERSNFVEGSLLRKVEAEQGPLAPIIDRGKGDEVAIGTGEGV